MLRPSHHTQGLTAQGTGRRPLTPCIAVHTSWLTACSSRSADTAHAAPGRVEAQQRCPAEAALCMPVPRARSTSIFGNATGKWNVPEGQSTRGCGLNWPAHADVAPSRPAQRSPLGARGHRQAARRQTELPTDAGAAALTRALQQPAGSMRAPASVGRRGARDVADGRVLGRAASLRQQVRAHLARGQAAWRCGGDARAGGHRGRAQRRLAAACAPARARQ